MRSLAIIAILAVTSPAFAQPAAALGKPLPSADLPAGTVVVRALGTGITDPLANAEITLVVDGKPRKLKTDTSGRAQFDGVAAHAKVKASVADATGHKATSEEFAVPADGGVRVMLATRFIDRPSAMPSPRDFSGNERADDKLAAGTLAVRLSYNDLADTKPPAGVAVFVVGYAESGAVTFATHTSDAHGEATFEHLAPATAYYAMTELPRNGQLDRLVSSPIVLGRVGVHVVLSSDKRDSKAAPIDDLVKWDAQKDAVAADHVRVALFGAPDETSTVDVFDAATAKPIAHATIKAPVDHADIAIKAHAGQVLYAETAAKSVRYRSHPFQTLPRAGTTSTIYVLPPLLVGYQIVAQPSDPVLDVSMRITVSNYTWAPKTLGEIPLPKGFAKLDADDSQVKPTTTGITLNDLVGPGDQHVNVAFQLPATANRVAWSLDLPYGAWKSQIAVLKEPGVTMTAPAGTKVETRSSGNGDYLVVSDIQIIPKQAMAMTIQVPTLPPLERTCRKLRPEASAMVGKPAPEITLPQLDGKTFKLSSLRGNVVVLNMTASWDIVARQEWPTFANIALPNVVPVVMFSDAKPDEVRPLVDATKSRVVLDAPPGDTNIGTVTLSWGTKLLPETYLIDRKGVVRYYIVNWRDWSGAEAKACLSALAR